MDIAGSRGFSVVLLALRIAWVALAALGGPALAASLEGVSTPVAAVAGVLAALGWGAGIVAVLVPRSVGLTAVRVLAPLALGAAVAAASRSGVGVAEVVALAGTALVCGLALLVPAVSDAFVDGSSYGAERRFALRVPVAVLVGVAPLAWLLAVGPGVVGALCLAARAWVPGVLLVAVGAVATRPAVRSLHQLARRWVVFVPAGIVLHDPLVLADPVLVPKRMVRALRPAEQGDEAGALDASRGTTGLLLALDISTPTPVGLRRGRAEVDTVDATRLLFAPGRPGAVLAEARSRGIA